MACVSNIIRLLKGTKGATDSQTNADIQRYLPTLLDQLSQITSSCTLKAQEMEEQFQTLLALTMEINDSCSATQGLSDASHRDAEMQRTILTTHNQAKAGAKVVQEQHHIIARAAWEDAQKQFASASKSLPNGWDYVGQQLVEGISKSLVKVIHAGINLVSGHWQRHTAVQNNAINTAQGYPIFNPSEATLYCPSSYDPAYRKADSIENVASLLHGIMTGGPGGGVDWDLAAGDGETSGLDFLKATLTTDLALEFGVTPAALTAKKLISTGLEVLYFL
ncbi:hypothetical protein FRB98_000253 [Tulasnella sp. 332]|nr:hypothetical protein FRB98_000253 [Tulasnella sp. 332]